MSRNNLAFALALVLLAFAPAAQAQQQDPGTFTSVAEWTIPRAQWAEYEAALKKDTVPVLQKLQADGTIISWGVYTTMVHQEDRETHGQWFEAASIANLEKALAELVKTPNTTINNPAVKHHDFVLRNSLRRSRAGSGMNGYLWVSSSEVQPGKGGDWRELFDQYNKPVYDELVANGTIAAYWLVTEYVHTLSPAIRWVAYLTPVADGIDKVRAAFAAAAEKRGPDANRGVGRAFADVTVAGVHRDYAARVTSYAVK
jgi:hypothetical protein